MFRHFGFKQLAASLLLIGSAAATAADDVDLDALLRVGADRKSVV